MLDPARWPRRLQGAVLLAVLLLWLTADVIGADGGWLVSVVAALGIPLFGALPWRYESLPWSEIASWGLPLLLWTSVTVVLRPTVGIGVVAFGAAGLWMALIVNWTPFVPCWYGHILHRPFPFNR